MPHSCVAIEHRASTIRLHADIIAGELDSIVLRNSVELRFFADTKALQRASPWKRVRFPPTVDSDSIAVAATSDVAVTVQPARFADGLALTIAHRGAGERQVSVRTPRSGPLIPVATAISHQRLFIAIEAVRPESELAVSLILLSCAFNTPDGNKLSKLPCEVFRAPTTIHNPLSLAKYQPDALEPSRLEPLTAECGRVIAWTIGGWTWLVDPEHGRQTLLPAQGIARCADNFLVSYRAGRIDEMHPDWQPLIAEPRSKQGVVEVNVSPGDIIDNAVSVAPK